jgi:hypothetical protein
LSLQQCCQRVHFQTENTNLGKFWMMEMLLFFMAILSILRQTGIFYAHLVRFVLIWCIFHRFGMLYREKIWQPCSAPNFMNV